MGIYWNPGNDAFRREACSKIYVDKTGLIEYTNRVLGTGRNNICVSRPRRFGKSMAANMLCAYYDKECDSRELFQDKQIASTDSYEEHLNRHDVIFLNIQQFMRGAGSLENLASYIEKRVLEEICEVYSDFVKKSEENLPNALAAIYAKISQEQKGFIFIIDEWDCIFREAKDNKEGQKRYLDFLRDLLKDRSYVKLAYMTGILPIKKYGTHSALNIFDEFSMIDPKFLAKYVGFTEEEVKELCSDYYMDFKEAKRWYDGYVFEDYMHIYNPKSIVDSMYNRKFKSYWTRTETYEALRIYLDMNFDGLKDAVVSMLGGGSCQINPEKFQNDMTSFEDRDDVLTLLVHLGYLAYQEREQKVFIPNAEIAGEFRNAIEGSKGWERLAKVIRNSKTLLEATLNGDEETVAKGIEAAHMEHVSILSYNDENSLSCVISLAYFYAQRDYTLIPEMPGGKGFADIVFLPRRTSPKPAMIVELKWNFSAKGAIEQIKERQYGKALENYSGDMVLVAVNYDKQTRKHSCVIENFDISRRWRNP